MLDGNVDGNVMASGEVNGSAVNAKNYEETDTQGENKVRGLSSPERLHALWLVFGVIALAVSLIVIVLPGGNMESDTDILAEGRETAVSDTDLSGAVTSGNALPFFPVDFEEEGAEIDAFRELLQGEGVAVVEPEFHGYQLFSDYEWIGEETTWKLRVGEEATLTELLEAYFADGNSGAEEILYALTDIGGDGKRELYVRAKGNQGWGYTSLVMVFCYMEDDLHLVFAEEEGERSSLTMTAKGYVQSSGSTSAASISGETGRIGADGSYEEWYHFEAGSGEGVHSILNDWDAYKRVFLDEDNHLEEEPQMEADLYTIDGKLYYAYSFFEEATQAQRDKCQEYLELCGTNQGIAFTPWEELEGILQERQRALGITDDMVVSGLENPDPIEWRDGFSYVFDGESEWQRAYYKVLCEARRHNDMMREEALPFEGYYLYDIDKDGIPELLLQQGGGEADYSADIYTWRAGETVCLGTIGMGHTSLYTWEGENAIMSYWAHMGVAFVTKISVDGNGLSQDDFFREDINDALREDSDVWYTDVEDLAPDCVGLAEYRIDLDLPLVSYETVMGAAVENPAMIPNEEVERILLDTIENNGMVYGVTGDGFGGDTGYVSFEEYCAPKSVGKYAKTPLQVDKYLWVDVNGDGQTEMVLDLHEDEAQKGQNALYEEIRVILSLQDEVVYAYCLNYMYEYSVLENGAFYVDYGNYEFMVRFLFDRDECFRYYVAEAKR
ncbi:MAG: hypothetical protein NC092_05560 [Butyrivibrio sp.]|nr:hypothetical protein [Muribaculum sp.]MCM1552142.1 hypothetical protein [Butyrivibrio sp.]